MIFWVGVDCVLCPIILAPIEGLFLVVDSRMLQLGWVGSVARVCLASPPPPPPWHQLPGGASPGRSSRDVFSPLLMGQISRGDALFLSERIYLVHFLCEIRGRNPSDPYRRVYEFRDAKLVFLVLTPGTLCLLLHAPLLCLPKLDFWGQTPLSCIEIAYGGRT